MIVDQIANGDLYARIDDRIAVALKYLQNNDLSKFAVGKYSIEGDDIFAQVSEYNTKEAEEVKWEAHRSHVDIQVMISGEEKMGHGPLSLMKVTEKYNAEKDITFLEGEGNYLAVHPGTFVIFFPQDAHQPGISVNGSMPVKKMVIKIKNNFWNP